MKVAHQFVDLNFKFIQYPLLVNSQRHTLFRIRHTDRISLNF